MAIAGRHAAVRAGIGLSLTLAGLVAGCGATTSSSVSSSTAMGSDAPVSLEPATSAPPAALDIGSSTYKPAAGRDGGALTIGAVEAANVFQPYFVADASDRAVAAAAWAGLVTLGPDGRYLPVLAASVPTTGDGSVTAPGAGGDAMTVHWRLRDGLAWSDGQPLTCDDVRWTWQWARDPDNIGVDSAGFEDLADVECRSDTDMVWHFSRVYGPYLDLLPTPLPRHALESIAMTDLATGKGFTFGELPKLPVSGPFRFTSAVPGSDLEMARNGHFQNPATGKPAHLATLRWRWFGSSGALVSAMKSHDVDAAIGLTGTDLDPAPFGDRALRADSLAAETLVLNWSGAKATDAAPSSTPDRGCSRSVLVSGRGGCPVADAAIRAAIAAAVDRPALAAGPLAGRATPVAGDVPDVLWFATGGGRIGPDPARARQVLDKAGWTVGPGGVRTKDGVTAKIEICALDAPWRLDAARLVAEQLAAVGIAAQVSPASSDDLAAQTEGTPGACSLPGGNFDAALVPVESPTDPLGTYFAWHSSQIPPNGTNVGAVADRDLDTALDAVRGSVDPAARKAAMATVEDAAAVSVPDVPLVRVATLALVGPTLKNVLPSPVQDVATWNIADWFRTR